jgi:hypothetical protein
LSPNPKPAPSQTALAGFDRPLFRSLFLGGFECSSHRRADGRRLDLSASTGHDCTALADYQALADAGIYAVRDGLRWHRIETHPGQYDWSSFLPMLRAARAAGVQPTWDLCHYGWPDDLDIWSAAFVDRFAAFCAAAARIVREEGDDSPTYCPINEISFWAWAGGEMGQMNPVARRRGNELKRQLVRASIAAITAIREVEPAARFITAEPLIYVASRSHQPRHIRPAKAYGQSQYEALDLLTGIMEPELGGNLDFLDILGLNYYPSNQWYHKGPPIPLGHHAYRPLRDLLSEAHSRYGRPVLLAETGAEGSARPAWLHYICDEVREARQMGVPIGGICLYPILDYPGWQNGRVCSVGLLSMPDKQGRREICAPFAAEVRRQQQIFAEEDSAAPPSFGAAAQ